jgi:hypothetical protein
MSFKLSTITFLFLLLTKIAVAQEPVIVPLYFGNGITTTNEEGVEVLTEMAHKNNTSALRKVVITAYIDAAKDEKANAKMADDRSYAIYNIIFNSGIKAEIIGVVLQHFNSDENPELIEKQLHNLVEIQFVYGGSSYLASRLNSLTKKATREETVAEDAPTNEEAIKEESKEEAKPKRAAKGTKKAAATKEESLSLQEPLPPENKDVVNPYFKTNSRKPQLFKEENAKYEITITGKEGTVITFPKQSFVNNREEVIKEPIEIQLRECYRKSDLILNNLTTFSDERLLQTAGMVYIAAKYKGEDLHLKSGQSIEIVFNPKNKKINTVGLMPFFSDTLAKYVNWKEAGVLAPVDVDNKSEKRKGFKMENLPDSVFDVNMLAMNVAGLNWINCARIMTDNGTSSLAVETDTSLHPAIFLVVKKSATILPLTRVNNKYIVGGAPLNRSAVIVAISEKNKEVFFGMKEIKLSGSQVEKLIMQKSTAAAVKAELMKLDRN